MLWVINGLLLMLLGLGGVAFVTLLERKILGLSQLRLGPNKTSLFGLLQPVADGVKLLLKEMFYINQSQFFFFTYSPILLLILFLISWSFFLGWESNMTSPKYTSLLFFSLLGLSAYAVILTGWSSLSSFSKLGSLRGMLQSLSFEVALILTFMVSMILSSSLMLKLEMKMELEILVLWMLSWLTLSLMETNRAPFDLLEGESELISGFNIELGSLAFVFLFLSEYGMILVMSTMASIGVFGWMSMVLVLITSILLFLRSCFPRVRYDIMMTLMWEIMLPVMISIFFLLTLK